MKDYRELEQKYIHLFECVTDNMPVRGIECGPGWYDIIECLLERFDWLRTHNTYIPNPEYDPDDDYSNYADDRAKVIKPFINNGPNEIKIFNIKEKFGQMRCHITVKGTDIAEQQAHEFIAFAEGQTQLTCEQCGRVGDIDGTPLTPTKGWINYICTNCKNERINND